MSEFDELVTFLCDNEDWIIQRLISYAKEHDFVDYTSTLEEAWRASIKGINHTIQEEVAKDTGVPEHNPHKDYVSDPLAAFGVLEAKRHRPRGITLSMFLGLTKYYRQSYIDCVFEGFPGGKGERYRYFLDRVFEHIEIGFIEEWTSSREPDSVRELQEHNRNVTNEKNRYLTIFESIPQPVAILDSECDVITVNHSYSQAFLKGKVPGEQYYGSQRPLFLAEPIVERINDIVKHEAHHGSFEIELDTADGIRQFEVQTTKMQDISEKFRGMIILFVDMTERERMLNELKLADEKIRLLGDMTRHDVLNLLTVMNGNLQLLEVKNSDPALSKYIKGGIEASKDIQKLLDASRDYQRLGSHEPIWIRLCEAAGKGLDIANLEDKKVTVDIDKNLEVFADPLLDRAFSNLAFNIAMHSNLSRNVLIRTEMNNDGSLSIIFEDDGPGISRERKPALFNENISGRTGHGLHFVHRLLQLTNITIREDGVFGEGARFIIIVPRSGHRKA